MVESPTKVKTIQKYLDRGFVVKASLGHLKDLPKSKLGIDVKKGFTPQYVPVRTKAKTLEELKQAGKKAKALYVATDPDREGEAIGWHIAQELGLPPDKRLPGALQRDHREGGQGRLQGARADRPEEGGRPAGPARPRSPGRLQDQPAPLGAGPPGPVGGPRPVGRGPPDLRAGAGDPGLRAPGVLEPPRPPGRRRRRPSSSRRSARRPARSSSRPPRPRPRPSSPRSSAPPFVVKAVDRGERRKNPAPPFITSTLQQDAARKLRFSASKTMMVAQQLYEGVEIGNGGPVGLITYMRTDSPRVAAEAQAEARDVIAARYGRGHAARAPAVLPGPEVGPGGPRGDPPDAARPRARAPGPSPQPGPAGALPADLGALPGEPDARRRSTTP